MGGEANTHGIEYAVISIYCQNDLGLTTANTLADASAGARQLEVTVNGIGERAGNASLEEVIMDIRCRSQTMGALYTGIDTKHIHMASRIVAEYSGLHVQPRKAIVGANAFAHESGIHQDGMLKFKAPMKSSLLMILGYLDLKNQTLYLEN